MFRPISPFPREGRGPGNGINDRLCLRNEVSLKILKVQGSESFGAGGHMQVPGEWCTQREHGCSTPLPMYLALLVFSISMFTYILCDIRL